MVIRKKYKIDRSLLQNTLGTSKSSFNKKKYKPGIHKNKEFSRSSYCSLLVHKQRLRALYRNMTDKQLLKILQNSLKSDNYKFNVVKMLESRLDSVLFRSGSVLSFIMARQLISHRHIYVNGKKQYSCSYSVCTGDSITFDEVGNKICIDAIKRSGRKCPNYLFVVESDDSVTINVNFDNLGIEEDSLDVILGGNDLTKIMRFYKI
ncbi:30S ribosomal protein S4 [bacterium AB1]|nr:30S ribosomal protein S4 [bacterium AB1]